MFAGVVAGIADYFGIDVTLARVGYVVVSLISAAFPGLFAYVILAFVIPEEEPPSY